MNFAILALAALLPQDDKGEGLYIFPVGTTWVYEEIQQEEKGEKKKRVVMKVLKAEEGKTEIKSQDFADGSKEPTFTKTLYSYLEDGYVVWGREVDGKMQAQVRFFKVGAKKGDTWTFGEGKKAVTLTHMGTTELTVKAGTYKDVIQVQMIFGDATMTGTADFFLVNGIGMIKAEMKLGTMVHNIIELQEFTPAK